LIALKRSPYLIRLWAGRVETKQADVIFTSRHPSARAGDASHFAKYFGWMLHVLEQISCVDEIKTGIAEPQLMRVSPYIVHARIFHSRGNLV
jgi:hypothetical protein